MRVVQQNSEPRRTPNPIRRRVKMKSSIKPTTSPWRRTTGLWPTTLPSGEMVLEGGDYRLCTNKHATEPGQPSHVLFRRDNPRPSQELNLPL